MPVWGWLQGEGRFAAYAGLSVGEAKRGLRVSKVFKDTPRAGNVYTNADRGSTGTAGMLIDETLDAATPYEGSLTVRTLFPRSSLLAEPGGTTHAGTLFGNACVDGHIAAFLATGVLPARKAGRRADATCKPFPRPVPSGAAATQTLSRSRPKLRPSVLVHR